MLRSAFLRYCEGWDFPLVQELKLNKWVLLRGGGRSDVWLGRVDGFLDSYPCRGDNYIESKRLRCKLSHLAYISKLVGEVTVLLTQFSFANWIGNHTDELGEVDRKLRDVQRRVNFLHPEATIPFASFIYFCNQENSWMNEFAICPQRIADLNLPG